jgi:hypothetical protein
MIRPMPSVSAIVWAQAVTLGHFEVGDRGGPVTTDLHHRDGAVERRATVGRRSDRCLRAERRDDA